MLNFKLKIASPEGFDANATLLEAARAHVEVVRDPRFAAEGADLVVTDVWASMGQEEETEERAEVFSPYRVDEDLMALAKPDAFFLHCLPAHRGAEVTAGVIDGPASLVFDQAENRLHVQKAVMLLLMADRG